MSGERRHTGLRELVAAVLARPASPSASNGDGDDRTRQVVQEQEALVEVVETQVLSMGRPSKNGVRQA